MAQEVKDRLKAFANSGVTTLGLAVDTGKESNHPEASYPTSKPWAPKTTEDTIREPSTQEGHAVRTTPPAYKGPTGTEKGADFSTTEGGELEKYVGEGGAPTNAEKAGENPLKIEKGADFSTTEGGALEKYV